MRYHTVFLDECVRVRNMMNSQFRADSPCSIYHAYGIVMLWPCACRPPVLSEAR
jgi:hypothetical protein